MKQHCRIDLVIRMAAWDTGSELVLPAQALYESRNLNAIEVSTIDITRYLSKRVQEHNERGKCLIKCEIPDLAFSRLTNPKQEKRMVMHLVRLEFTTRGYMFHILTDIDDESYPSSPVKVLVVWDMALISHVRGLEEQARMTESRKAWMLVDQGSKKKKKQKK